MKLRMDDAMNPCQACEDAARVCEALLSKYGNEGWFEVGVRKCVETIRSSCRHAQPAASEVMVPREKINCALRGGCIRPNGQCEAVKYCLNDIALA